MQRYPVCACPRMNPQGCVYCPEQPHPEQVFLAFGQNRKGLHYWASSIDGPQWLEQTTALVAFPRAREPIKTVRRRRTTGTITKERLAPSNPDGREKVVSSLVHLLSGAAALLVLTRR